MYVAALLLFVLRPELAGIVLHVGLNMCYGIVPYLVWYYTCLYVHTYLSLAGFLQPRMHHYYGTIWYGTGTIPGTGSTPYRDQ